MTIRKIGVKISSIEVVYRLRIVYSNLRRENVEEKSKLWKVAERTARTFGAESGLAENRRKPSRSGCNTARVTAVIQYMSGYADFSGEISRERSEANRVEPRNIRPLYQQ